jgi:DNA-binding NtrC family response regulator
MAGYCENLPQLPPTDRTVSVLAVSPYDEDHSCLRTIFSHSNWRIYHANDCRDALSFLGRNRVAVLVCEEDLPDGSWRDLLESISGGASTALLIVTSRHAGDSLWAEVLNLGGYDVLSKPFDRAEVTRIISLAWLHWKEEMERSQRRPVARVAAAAAGGAWSATAS